MKFITPLCVLAATTFLIPMSVATVAADSKPVENSPAVAASDRNEAGALFQRLRNGQLEPLNANTSLAIVTRTLAATGNPTSQTALLRGMKAGLEGQRQIEPPRGWSEVSKTLLGSQTPDIVTLTQELGQIFGDKAAIRLALETLKDRSLPASTRRAALHSLVAQQNPELPAILPELIAQPSIRLDAIRAYSNIRIEKAPQQLLSLYSKIEPNAQRAVIETLASRRNYAESLLAAIKRGQIEKNAIPTYTARSLSEMLGESFTEVYGDLSELSADKEQLISKYRALLTNETVLRGDLHAGKAVYARTCSACHVLYGEGGKIGPNLTGSNRADLDYILLNMLDPSGDIPEAYQLVTIATKNGQLVAGTVADEDDQRLVLNSIGLQRTILKSDIKDRSTSPYSMMPEGLLLSLPDKDVINLVKYLRTTETIAATP
jgi:putative heme-binding domain-containing protein